MHTLNSARRAFAASALLLLFAAPIIALSGVTGIDIHLLSQMAGRQTPFLAVFVPLILVFIVEMLNSAVEAVVDRIGPERHELSGRAKDLGSAAVSFALLHFVVVWLFVLFG